MAKKKISMAKTKKPETRPQEVNFDYVKSKFHRVISANGVHGGPTPNGKLLALSFFNERLPIPVREVFDVASDGKIADRPKTRTQRDAIVREVETTVMLDRDVAVKVRDWLTTMIEVNPQSIHKPS